MRLLNARTLKMEYFLSEDDFPPFAILSHTWGKEEVKFAETLLPGTGEGWTKINYTCQQAIRDKIDWVWIDTCCIDKSDSAELSESINSMFRWYQISTVCYAYLADVSVTARQRNEPVFESDISRSRWFTRGWTLQELVAPKIVRFYSKNWEYIGSKTDFCSLLSSITRIAKKYLTGHDIFTASIAQRMSWASRRQTTRKEDIAYCLFGIFDINMPSVYGEGTKAFRRLQLAIIQAYPEDHTIYAWGAVVEKVSWLYPEDKAWADTPPKWEDAEEREELGLLASSPKDFEESGLFVPTPFGSDFYMLNQYDAKLPAQIGNTTIRLDLPVYPGVRLCLRRQHALQMAQLRYVWYAALFCGLEGDFMSTVAIPLEGNDLDSTVRTREIVRCTDPATREMLDKWKTTINIGISPSSRLHFNDIVFRREIFNLQSVERSPVYRFPNNRRGHMWKSQHSISTDNTSPDICELPITLKGQDKAFSLFLRRTQNEVEYASSLSVSVVLFRNRKDTEVSAVGCKWLLDDKSTLKTTFTHKFACPADEWVLDVKPLPRIFLRVEKVQHYSGLVYVLDLTVA